MTTGNNDGNIQSSIYEELARPFLLNIADPTALNAKIPAGNFPRGFSNYEALTLGQVSAILKAIITEKVNAELQHRIDCVCNTENKGGFGWGPAPELIYRHNPNPPVEEDCCDLLRYLTSKPYPFYFEEALSTLFDLRESRRILPPDASENISNSFALLNATTREPMNVTDAEVERFEHSFALLAATKRSVITTVSNSGYETVEHSFALTRATQRAALLSITTEAHSIEHGFALLGAKITN